MKIYQVVESFGGGVYSFLVDLCNEMAKNHEVTIIYSERKETPKNFENDFNPMINFIKLDMSLKKSVSSIKILSKILKEKKPDIVHLHSSKAGFVGRLATTVGRYKGKLFYNPHGLSFLRLDLSKVFREIFRLSEFCLAKLGGVVIAVSESEKKEVQKLTRKVININNGIDTETLEKELFTIHPYKEKGKQITIGTVGRVEFQKNPILFNQLAENFPNINFVWIGDGTLKHELKSKNIRTTGWVTRSQALKQISDFDIYIQTSLWEGLPIAVLEAMYLGKPLIVNNSVGNIDLVREGYNGCIFNDITEAQNYIKELSENIELISKYGENSHLRIQKEFTLNKMINSYKKCYFD
ncbi:glycosyltransferase [Bacillus sp. AFS029533]|uniref:glycosyltransferase n=1 Tax=Bacillus sp. AFS029533 TaxID=2033494 RepID=UPI000BFCD24B|nr:glycosyltransferase [Bacillus sp. AFS029533]PGZ91715.1 glycosyl transferase [Bacillus sp. AFS029533]